MLPQVENLDPEQEALVDWAVLQLQGSEGKCQRTRLGVKDFSTQVKPVSVDKSYSNYYNSGCCGRPLQVHAAARAHEEQGVRHQGGD